MKYEYLTNIPLAQAQEDYIGFLKNAGMECREETIPVQQALGRITAKAVYANLCAPHYVASAMDGIAITASKTFGATETTPVTLAPEDYVQVDTGDPIPDDCDAVVMIEDVVSAENGVKLYAAAIPWQHIRQIGEDICAGDMLLPSYTEITPAAMGAMLAGGVFELPVLKKPVVGILPTGDEIVLPMPNPAPGDIMEFNSTIFSGMLTQWGAEPRVYPIVKDNKEALSAAISSAIEECDCLLIGAGTSAGRDDYTTTLLNTLGEVLYHGIAIKPGKPAVLARIGAKPVMGIPGYPVSGIVVLEQLLKPVVYALLHQPLPEEPLVQAKLSKRVTSSLKYREYLRARLSTGPDGMCAVPLNRGAGVVTSFVKADALVDIPQNAEGYEAGDVVTLKLLRPMQEIQNTISIVGSHDPLLDEAGDILRRQTPGLAIASSHVGSMGGILAIRRGEAMMAGIHLLDPATGEYNKSYVQRYFPDRNVTLVRAVGRVQGILTAPGNPHKIEQFSDIVGLRYVNRQGGSGTRILCDHLVQKNGLRPEEINGYTREEFTHTAVAAQIAQGSADAGLGIYAAARLYGLDFIPICNEEYDLLIHNDCLHTPLMQRFLDILKSEDFCRRLAALGGYVIEDIGKEIPVW